MESCKCKTIKVTTEDFKEYKNGTEHIISEDENSTVVKTCNRALIDVGEELMELND